MQKRFLKFIQPLLVVLFCGHLQAQLSGNYNVPITYTSIAAAISALNSQGVSGPVFINISAGYTETAPVGGYSLTASGSSLNPITFRKIGIGANPLISAYAGGSGTPSSAIQDGVWRLIGSDYITIDGIDINDPNLTNPATMEYGYGLFKSTTGNGCQNNTIQNCTITLKRINNAAGAGPATDGSRAINVVNSLPNSQTTVLTPTAASGTNSYNKFYSNTLQNCNIGIALIGYAAVSPFTLADTDNEIGSNAPLTGNSILNFGGATAATNPAAGIRTLAQYNLLVVNNSINNNTGSGVNHVSALRGIYLNTATSANASVSGNTITLNSAASTAVLAAIENLSGATAANNTITLSNNLISNCTNSANTTGSFYGIYNNGASASYLNINGNVFTGFSTKASSGSNYMIYNTGAVSSVITITNNIISAGTNSASTSGSYYGVFSNAVSSAWLNMSSNTFSNVSSYAASGSVYGIYNSSAISNSITLMNNTFLNCTYSISSTGNYFGIHNNGIGTAGLNMSLNGFQTNTVSVFSGAAYHLYNTGANTNAILFNSNSILNSAVNISSTGSYYALYNNAASTASLQMNGNVYTANTHAATTGSVHVIYNRGAFTNTFTSASFSANLISNCNFSATSTAPFLGIYNNGVSCNSLAMTNNSLSAINWQSSTASKFLLYNSAQVFGTFDFNNNLIEACTATLNTTGNLNGILNTGACTVALNMSDNTFTNCVNNASNGNTYLMFNSGAAASAVITITNNSVSSFSNTVSGTGSFNGIYTTGTNYTSLSILNSNFSNNKWIASTGFISLIQSNGVATNSVSSIRLSDNVISNSSASITSNAPFYGIYNSTASSQTLHVNTNSITNFTIHTVNGANYLLYNSGAITSTYTSLSMNLNTISNCTFSASAAAGFYNIWNNGVRTQTTSINSNTITNSTWNSLSALIYGLANFGTATSNGSVIANRISNCTFTSNTSGSFFGIYVNNPTTVSSGVFSINSNTLTNVLRTASTGETHWINISGVTTNTFSGIELNTNLISSNTQSSSSGGPFYGIYNNTASSTSLAINSNTFTGNTHSSFTGASHFIYTRGVAGSLFSAVNINSNVVSNHTHSLNSNGAFYGLFHSGVATSTTGNLSMNANTFTNTTLVGGTGAMYLISSTCPSTNSISILSNTLSQITNSTSSTGLFYGIHNTANVLAGSLDISTNVFTNLNSSASTGNRYLLYNGGGISNTLTMNGNVVSNCNHHASGNASYFMINNNSAFSGSLSSINSNSLSNLSTTLVTGSNYLILNSGALSTTLNTIQLLDNSIDNYSYTATNGPFFGISNTGMSALDLSIHTNSLTNLTFNTISSARQLFLNTARVNTAISFSNNLISTCVSTLNTAGSFYGINNTLAYANGNYPANIYITNNRILNTELSSSNGAIYFINNSGVNTNTVLSSNFTNNLLSGHSHTITTGGIFYGISNSVISNSILSVADNTLTNIVASSTASARYMINNSALLVSSGSFSTNLLSDYSSTLNTTGSYYGIHQSGNAQGDLMISNNRFLNHNLSAGTGSMFPILNSGIISGSIQINSNLFSNMNHIASSSGGFTGIYNNAGSSAQLLISANTFTNLNLSTNTGATQFIFNRAAVTGTIGVITITNTAIGSCSFTANSGPFYGIFNSGNSYGSMAVGSNSFASVIPNSASANRFFIYNTGVGLSSGTLSIQNNLISGFNATLNAIGNFYGIYNQGNTLGHLSVVNNTLSNLNLNASSGTSYMIYNSGSVNSNELNNNLISTINNSCSTTGAYYGIFNQASTSNALSINSNTLVNINVSVPSAATYLFYNNGIASNTISSTSLSYNSLSNFTLQSVSGNLFAVLNNALRSLTLSISNNTLSNIALTTSTSTRYLFYNTGPVSGSLTMNLNHAGNLTSTVNSTGSFFGLNNGANCFGSAEFNNNSFSDHNLSSTTGSVIAFYNSGIITNSLSFANNSVTNFSNTSAAASFFAGIYNNAGSSSYLSISANTFSNILHQTSTGAIHFIYNRGASTNSISSIQIVNNSLSAFTFTASTGPFYGIFNNATSFSSMSVGGNTLAALSSTTTSGARFFIYNTGTCSSVHSVTNNYVSNFTSLFNTTGAYNGIYTTGNNSGSLIIANNTFSNQLLTASTASAFVIYNSGIVSNSISLNGNVISGFTHSASTSGGFFGLYNNAGSSGNLQMSSNTFSNLTLSSSTGPAYMLYNRAAIAGTISDLSFSNNQISSLDFTTNTGALYGINNTGTAFSNLSVTGNSIINIATTATASPRYMIFNNGVGATAINISTNQVTNFTSTLNTTGLYYGILNSGACAGDLNIDANTITNLNLTASTASIVGIHNSAAISNSISISGNGLSAVSCSSTSGPYNFILNTSAPAAFVSVSNNTLSGINISNSVSAKYLVFTNSGSSSSIRLNGNQITGYSNSNNLNGITYLLYNSGSASNEIEFNNNSLSNLATNSSTTSVYSLFNSGSVSNPSGNIKLTANSVSTHTHTSANGSYYGIYNSGSSAGALHFNDNAFTNAAITATAGNRFILYTTGNVNSNISFTNNLIASTTVSANSGGGFYGIYNSGVCQGSLNLSSNDLNSNILETASGPTYLIANTASVTSGIVMDNNSINGYTNSIGASGDLYGIVNTGSLSPTLSMSGNTFTNNVSGITSGNIQLIANSGSISNSITFNGNTLTQGLSNTSTDFSGNLNAIYNSGGTPSSSVSISNNNFSDILYTGVSGTGNLYCIHNSNNNAALDITGNTWTNLSLNHNGNEHLIYNPSSTQSSLSVMNNSVIGGYTRTGTAGALFMYYSNGNSPATCTQEFTGNNFSNITANTQGTGSFYGLYSSDGQTSSFPKKLVHHNVISAINYNGLGFMYGYYFDFLGDAGTSSGSAIYNNTLTGVSWNGPFYGIYSAANVSTNHSVTIYANVIQNVTSNGQNADVYGAYLQSGGTGLHFYKNKISDLSSNGTSGTASGIYIAGTGAVNLSNNLTGNIYTPSTSVTNALNGIYIAGGSSVNLVYNTVLLNATGTGSNFASNAMYALSSVNLNLQNNIFINTSVANGIGITTSFRRSSSSLTNYAGSSNNNVFYAGIPAFNRVLYHDGTNAYLTLPAFQTAVTPRENLSVSENSPMLSVIGTSSNFLHIDTTIPSLTENGAQNAGGITDDYDTQIRQGNTGYTGIGIAPDIGADEYDANLTPCLGANAGTVIIPSSTVRCSGETIYMLSNGYTAAGGIVHQWKVSNTPGGPYSNVIGGIGANYVAYTTPTLNAGVYYFVLVTTCTIGSISGTSNEVTVTVNQTPNATASIATQPLCAGQDLQLIATGNTGNVYTWLGPNNFTASIQNPTVTNVSSNSSGIYTLLVSDANCTASPVFVTATVYPSPPVFSLTPASASLCAGSSQTIGASIPISNPTLNFGSQTYQNSASGYPAPYSVYYGGQKMQMLVLAGELAAAGFTVGSPISSLQFTVNALGANWGNTLLECKDFKVSIKSTTTSILTAFETGLANVIGPINYTPVVGANNIHTFSAPFIWDGSSNVVIETVFSNSLIGTSANAVFQNNSPTGFQSTLVYRADNQNIATISAATTSNVNVGFVRPDFSLNGAQVGTYSWSPAAGLSSSNSPSVNASPTVTTVYTASLSNGQCATTSSILLNVILTPTVTIASSSSVVCIGNNATLTAGGATSYTWSTSSSATNIVVSPFVNTSYTVTGSNPSCPNASTSILILSAPALTLNTSMFPATLCQGQTATLSASGALTYTWSGGSNSSSIVVTPSLTTNYIVNASSGPGCWASKTVLAKVNPIPFISITPASATICPGQTITLEASGVFSFTWQPTNSVSPIIEISPSVTTVYTITGVDLNTCVNTATMEVIVDACVTVGETQGEMQEVSIYPNPSEGLVNISFPFKGSKNIRITNSLGALVHESQTENIFTRIDLTNYSKGVYFIRVFSELGESVQKLIIY